MGRRQWLWVAAVAGCNEQSLGTFNASPDVSIVSHAGGERVVEGTPVTVIGRLADPDDKPEELEASFSADDLAVCEGVVPDEDGEVRCVVHFGLGGGQVSLLGLDPGGASARANVALEVVENEAPEIAVFAPDPAGTWFEGRTIPVELRASDREDDPSALRVTIESSRDGALVTDAAPGASGELVTGVTLSVGEHVLSAKVTDTAGKVAIDTRTLVVRPPNTLPACGVDSPTTGAVSPTSAALALAAHASDDETPASGLTWAWRSDRDGDLAAGAVGSDGAIVGLASGLSVGTHLLTLTVTDADGGACTALTTARVAAPPTVTFTAPAGRAGAGLVDVAVAVTDPDGPADAVSVRLASSVNGDLGEGNAASDGRFALRPTLSAGEHTLTATVTDADGLTATARLLWTGDQAPVCDIVSPAIGDALLPGAGRVALATAADPDGGFDGLDVGWWIGETRVGSGLQAVLPPQPAGPFDLRLAVTDPYGGACERVVAVMEESPPEIQFVNPGGAAFWSAQDQPAFVARVGDVGDGPSNLRVELWIDGKTTGQVFSDADGLATFPHATLAAGPHVLQGGHRQRRPVDRRLRRAAREHAARCASPERPP